MALASFNTTGVFANAALAVPPELYAELCAVVACVEGVVASEHYQNFVLQNAPLSARRDHGPLGCILGYDFHLTAAGPRLIEINTNAGGLLLAGGHAQSLCSKGLLPANVEIAGPRPETIASAVVEMFRMEWSRQRGDAPLQTIAIVDETPDKQFLHPEFELYRDLFEAEGIRTVIADGCDLVFHNGHLWAGEFKIDLVYNRLCDFYLAKPEQASLRLALDCGATVVTPSPRAHALFAAKSNLACLCDGERLAMLGIAGRDISLLNRVTPWTACLGDLDLDEVWSNRRQLFFKPRCGYGSKAVYRGDKLTRRVWGEIVEGDYMVQTLSLPSMVHVLDPDGDRDMKLDVRLFTYNGKIVNTAARLYQGQTTNFRTPGGGFAPLILRPGASPQGEIIPLQEIS